MIYTLNEITETRAWLVRDAERLRKAFIEDAYEDQGVLRWKSNDRAVPPWSFREAFCTVSQTHLKAYDRETSQVLAEYRKAQANHVPDAEEMYEMRAAFGEGTTVVNAITGRRTRL
jgi:hypothetical protein